MLSIEKYKPVVALVALLIGFTIESVAQQERLPSRKPVAQLAAENKKRINETNSPLNTRPVTAATADKLLSRQSVEYIKRRQPGFSNKTTFNAYADLPDNEKAKRLPSRQSVQKLKEMHDRRIGGNLPVSH